MSCGVAVKPSRQTIDYQQPRSRRPFLPQLVRVLLVIFGLLAAGGTLGFMMMRLLFMRAAP